MTTIKTARSRVPSQQPKSAIKGVQTPTPDTAFGAVVVAQDGDMTVIRVGNRIITHDMSCDALAIYLKPETRGVRGVVKKTVELVPFGTQKGLTLINLDLDEAGQAIGVEII